MVVRYPDTLPLIQQAGVDESMFADDYQKVWRWLVRMKRNHGDVPSADTLVNRFDWIDIGRVRRRDLPILLSDVRKRHTHQQFVESLLEAVDAAEDYEVVGDVIQNLQGKLNLLVSRNGQKSALRDLFHKDTTAEIIEEVKRRRSGQTMGWPTGLIKLDNNIGGMQPGRMITVIGRSGKGKAQPLDAKILTPDGWRMMGDMRPGMRVLCPDGAVARVLQVHPQGKKDIYRVVCSDGATTRVTADHLWETQTRKERNRQSSSVKTTREIAASLRYCDGWNHYLPLVEPIKGQQQSLPLDPYVVGVLLGDSHIRQRGGAVEILLASTDRELVAEVNSLLPGGRFSMPVGANYRFTDDSDRWHKGSTVRESLVKLGMTNFHSWDKVVPAIYMQAEANDRLALLQGLLDTDGSPHNSLGAEFCSTSDRLAQQVRELTWSLGGVATISSRTTSYTHKNVKKSGRLSYRVQVTLPAGLRYFRLERKQSQIVNERQKIGRAVRTIRSVEKVGRAEAQCITIDHPRQLYITDDYIVTHNSWLDLLFAANAVVAGAKVVLYPLEMTLYETAFRLYTIFTQRCFGPEKVLKNFDLSQGRITPKKIVRFLGALEDRYAGQLYVADVGSLADPYTVERIEAEAEMHKPDLVWVDYITLLKAPRQARDAEYTAIRTLSNGGKGIAQRQKCVTGFCAQVNREAIKGNIFLPGLEHISFGDSIGHDSDQVVTINRKGRYLYYALCKNRHGPEFGRTRVKFFPDEGVIVEEKSEDE